jgi:hypothetical protein
MTTWSSGYVTDVGYLHGYCDTLNPLRLQLAFLDAKLVYPEIRFACELGFGQGISINMHSAASLVRWWGTDFNPAQVAFAREAARACNSGVVLEEQSFDEFCKRNDLPTFDYIGLHGVWSWISDENRATIVDFLHRKLRVGGVVSLSYNTLPGWAQTMPLRELFFEHSEMLSSRSDGVLSRMERALVFAERLLATTPIPMQRNSEIAKILETIATADRKYLAHEYLNQHWQPMSIAKVAHWLSAAKLEYACSADSIAHVSAVNLLPEQQAFLNEIPNPVFRESVRDFIVKRQFRRDYWIKGLRRLSPLEQAEQYLNRRVVLSKPRSDVNLEIEGVIGSATLDEPVYRAILDALADHRPRTIAELERIVSRHDTGFPEVVHAILLLTGLGTLSPAQDDSVIDLVVSRTEQLNRHLLRKSRDSDEFHYCASPVTGGGIFLERVAQLLLLSRMEGKTTLTDTVANVWKFLQMQGQRLIKENKVLNSDDENLAEIEAQAKRFIQRDLPMLEGLKVV